MADLPTIAVIADAHFHDPDSDFDGTTTAVGTRQLTLRTWKDSRKSSRVFNESAQALKTALLKIHKSGIRHVVLLGDYTDDGQVETTSRLVDLLDFFSQEHGIAFYAIPGNHDVHGPMGKHQSTRFVTSASTSVLVTSDAEVAAAEPDTSILTHKVYCKGSPEGLIPMAKFGLFKQKHYRYWETPFGQDDHPESRMFDAKSPDGKTIHRLMDASYLVEPTDGLWLLMIDANVFEPRNGKSDPSRKSTFYNCSDAGWNAMKRVKPFLFDWIKDVHIRAKRLNKTIVTFSHYPALDPFNDKTGLERKLFGSNENSRRSPSPSVANVLTDTDAKLHFSGHMHVNATSYQHVKQSKLCNIAVPSLASFPPCYKLIQANTKGCTIETVAINEMPLDTDFMNYYRAECDARKESHDAALSTSNYGDFLYSRMRSRAIHHYLKKDWPEDIASVIEQSSVADLAMLLLAQRNSAKALLLGTIHSEKKADLNAELNALTKRYKLSWNNIAACSMTTLIADWYCLRHAGPMTKPFIKPENIKLYQFLTQAFSERGTGSSESKSDTRSHYDFFMLFIEALQQAMQGMNQSETVVVKYVS